MAMRHVLPTSPTENETKMYVPSWTRGMTFAALLVTLTASSVIAQDTVSVASPDGRNKIGVL